MKTINNQEKINSITEDRKAILEQIKQNLCEHSNLTEDSISKILEVMHEAEKQAKEAKAIKSAKEMIADLTRQITNSTSIEDIIKIRKRINYYINKIKRILKARGIDETKLNELLNNVSYMRKDIAKYIQLLKRDKNIEEIMKLNDNYGPLSIDEIKHLKHLLKNETNYIKRFQLEPNIEEEPESISPEETTKDIPKDPNTKEEPESISPEETTKDIPKDPKEFSQWLINELQKAKKDTKKPEPLIATDINEAIIAHDSLHDPIQASISDEIQRYMKTQQIEKATTSCNDDPKDPNKRLSFIDFEKEENPEELAKIFEEFTSDYDIDFEYYGNSFFNNCKKFIHNLFHQRHNKKAERIVSSVYNQSRRYEYKMFIRYIQEHMSVLKSLKKIFNSRLFTREDECQNAYDNCYKWILDNTRPSKVRKPSNNRKIA